MNRLEVALRRLASDLEQLGLAWALVGGLAVSARAEPRFTRDIDVAIDVEDDAQAEKLVADLQAQGYRVFQVVEHESTGRLATARLVLSEHEGIVFDLLFASSGVEREIVAAAEPIDLVSGLVVPVAQGPHLVAMKLLSQSPSRLQDSSDLAVLLTVLTTQELEETRRLARLIESRGFNRGRDLVQALAQATSGTKS